MSVRATKLGETIRPRQVMSAKRHALSASAPRGLARWTDAHCRMLSADLARAFSTMDRRVQETTRMRELFHNRTVFVEDRQSGERCHYEVQVWERNAFPHVQRFEHFFPGPVFEEGLFSFVERDRRLAEADLARMEILRVVWNHALGPVAKADAIHQILAQCGMWARTTLLTLNSGWSCFPFIRMGPLFFLDSSYFSRLPNALQERLSPNCLLIPEMMQSSLGAHHWLKKYTLSAILGLMHMELNGANILDLGAGDGFLSLAALRLGATAASLVDCDRPSLARAVTYMGENRFDEGGMLLSLIHGDLREPASLATRLPLLRPHTVLLSNIGRWPASYGETTNATSLELIPHLAENHHITSVILGGYLTGDDRHGAGSDLELAQRYGFAKRTLRCEVERAEVYCLTRE